MNIVVLELVNDSDYLIGLTSILCPDPILKLGIVDRPETPFHPDCFKFV